MLDWILECITVAMLVVIAACQIKQAFFPVIYPDYESNVTGVEVPQDTEMSDDDPMYKMVVEAYEKSRQYQTPGAFVQKIIDTPDDTGVEIITDKDEQEGY